MTQYMFDRQGEEWFIKGSQEPVTILRQNYFVNVADGKKYSSEGTDWASFYKHVRSLMIGNEVDIAYSKGGQEATVHLKPAKLLVIEGSHIFMSP
jgi:uridine kinase